VLSGIVSLLTL